MTVRDRDTLQQVMLNLMAETDLTLGLAGCASFAELGRENLVEAR